MHNSHLFYFIIAQRSKHTYHRIYILGYIFHFLLYLFKPILYDVVLEVFAFLLFTGKYYPTPYVKAAIMQNKHFLVKSSQQLNFAFV